MTRYAKDTNVSSKEVFMKTKIMNVKIKLTENLLGTVPKDKEVYSTFIETKKPKDIDEEEAENIEQIEEKGWTGFHKDDKGLFVYDYFIKGYFKNAGNILKEQLRIKNLRSKLSDRLFIMPRRIYFKKQKLDDTLPTHTYIQSPDGDYERPIRVMIKTGPRVSLVRSDFIAAGTEIEFVVEWLANKEITKELIYKLLEYGKLQGLRQFRNGGFGRFEVVK